MGTMGLAVAAAFVLGAAAPSHGKPEAGHWRTAPPDSAVLARCDLDELKQVDAAAFRHGYLGKRPVVLRGAAWQAWQQAWQANGTEPRPGDGLPRIWTRGGLLAYAGDATVKVGSAQGILRGAGDGTTTMSLSRLVRAMDEAAPGGEGAPYLFDRGHFFAALPAARRQFPLPDLLPERRGGVAVAGFVMDGMPLAGEAANTSGAARRHTAAGGGQPPDADPNGSDDAGYDTYLLLGGNGTGVPFHFHADTLAALYQGHKRWFIQAPGPGGLPRHYHPRGMAHWAEENRARDASAERSFADVASGPPRVLQCVQRPGDVVYVPEGWHHATLNYGDTLAVARQARLAGGEELRLQNLASQLHAAGQHAESLAVHEELVARYPAGTVGLHSLASLVTATAPPAAAPAAASEEEDARRQKDRRAALQTAAQLLARVLESDPGNAEAATDLCSHLQELGLQEVAAEACETATSANPHSYHAQFYHGRLLAVAGLPGLAGGRFRLATELAGDRVEGHYNLANALMETRRAEAVPEAIRAFRTACRLQPDASHIHFQLGLALLRTGDASAAKAPLATASRDPAYAAAVEQLLGAS